MSGIAGYIKLIEQFNEFPCEKKEVTFMEICKYPYSRFEEVCSRILQFFFNPMAEHKLQNLLLNSLLEVIQQTEIRFDSRCVKIGIEEDAEQKRIDMIIEAPTFAICIENKIMSLVNNPLEKYKQECLGRYKDKHLIFLVLSVRRITNFSELRYINDCGFTVITYSDFFEVVKQNIGNYVIACNQKYLTYLLDFIKTIENMTNRIERNPENDFFFDHKDRYLDDDADGRVYLHVDKIEGNDTDLIIKKLSEYYQVVEKLAVEDLRSNKLV